MKKMSFLRKANLLTRAILFILSQLIIIIPYSFLCIAALILPLSVRYAMVTWWTRVMIWLLKHICLLEYKVEGLENIPKKRNGIVLSKHQSTWETFYLPSFFHQAAIIVKRELMWIPFFGWGLLAINPISINRSDKASAMDQILKKGKKALDSGRWILVFPEGTRMKPGVVGNYRPGGAKLAVQTGYPVIPVAHNAGYYWPKGRLIKIPGTIKVVIGPLIETQGRTAEEVTREAKEWIETTVKKIIPKDIEV